MNYKKRDVININDLHHHTKKFHSKRLKQNKKFDPFTHTSWKREKKNILIFIFD